MHATLFRLLFIFFKSQYILLCGGHISKEKLRAGQNVSRGYEYFGKVICQPADNLMN